MEFPHRPVMLAEVVAEMAPHPRGLYIDGTVGAGGHAAALLEASSPDGRLVGVDRDPNALQIAAARLAPFGDRVRLARTTFDGIPAYSGAAGADGILLDLGVSSMQLDQADRGFAFSHNGPLDMRMAAHGPSAADLVNTLPGEELARIFRSLGEEPLAQRYAAAIVRARREREIRTTARLAGLIQEAAPARVRRKSKIHPATRVFMALRMKVNDELGQLSRFLEQAPAVLAPGGRLVIIAYHSLEDRLVKQAMARGANPCTCPPKLPVCACGAKPLYTLPRRGALAPGPEEVAANPRARSARLRSAVRTREPL